ncbi:MAG: hypothetical protein JNN30_14150 [Rhodanobacteraceae bacterium]|nr:hypothetical protein [Rhodanobacteraceae bacterium]
MRDDIQALLPWYVNGTLNETERAAVESYLAEHPQERSALEFWRHAAAEQRHGAAVAAEDVGLDKTLERIRRETTGKTTHSEPVSRGWNWRWLDHWLRPALAVAMLVVVVQSVLLLRQSAQPPISYRGSTPPTPAGEAARVSADQAFLRVTFEPAATEGELRVLVAGAGGWVVGGPGLAGEYYLAVPKQSVVAATDALRGSHAVRDVAPVAQVPPQG